MRGQEGTSAGIQWAGATSSRHAVAAERPLSRKWASAIVVGGLYTAGFYMMMRRSMLKLVIGLALLSHATNLLIFTVSGVSRGRPPLIPEGGQLPAPVADPLPQALILTAIVIGFGILAFALALVHRTYESIGTDDLDQMRTTDK